MPRHRQEREGPAWVGPFRSGPASVHDDQLPCKGSRHIPALLVVLSVLLVTQLPAGFCLEQHTSGASKETGSISAYAADLPAVADAASFATILSTGQPQPAPKKTSKLLYSCGDELDKSHVRPRGRSIQQSFSDDSAAADYGEDALARPSSVSSVSSSVMTIAMVPGSMYTAALPPNFVPGVNAYLAPNRPDPAPSNAFRLHSRGIAKKVIYLNFQGCSVDGTQWAEEFDVTDAMVPPLSFDEDMETFSTDERQYIVAAWRLVSTWVGSVAHTIALLDSLYS